MQWLFPDIEDSDKAKQVSRGGAIVCFIVTVVTALIVFLQTTGKTTMFQGMGEEAYIDAFIFFAFGIGLWRCSRVCAVLALGLYIFEQILMIASGMTGGSILMLYFTLVLFNANRGAFAFHKLKKIEEQEESLRDGTATAKAAKKKRRSLGCLIFLLLGLGLIVLSCVIFFDDFKQSFIEGWEEGTADMPEYREPDPIPEWGRVPVQEEVVTPPVTMPEGDVRVFTLDTGREVRGVVTMEDPEFLIVATETGEEVLERKHLR